MDCAALPLPAIPLQNLASPAGPALLQLVPPGAGGVRDFADLLQRRWCEAGLDSRVEAIDAVAARTLHLARRLHPDGPRGAHRGVAVLLHYSGYGYQRRGLPAWLVRQLVRAQGEWGDNLRVVTYFHETFASGPPWRSAFWLSGVQNRIGSQVARLADAVCTNTGLHAEWLSEARAGAGPPPLVRPVFAAIGEPPGGVLSQAAREPVAVVLGAAATRTRALLACAGKGAQLRRHGIEAIVEVGPGVATAVDTGLPLRFVGRLETPELHRLLQRSHGGLIDYPASLLGKSSVFAALVAHGVAVLNTRVFDRDADGLQQGHHYLGLFEHNAARLRSLADANTRRAVVEAAWHWYQPHNSVTQAEELAALLGGTGGVAAR